MGLTGLSVSGRPCSPDGKVDRSMMLTTLRLEEVESEENSSRSVVSRL